MPKILKTKNLQKEALAPFEACRSESGFPNESAFYRVASNTSFAFEKLQGCRLKVKKLRMRAGPRVCDCKPSDISLRRPIYFKYK